MSLNTTDLIARVEALARTCTDNPELAERFRAEIETAIGLCTSSAEEVSEIPEKWLEMISGKVSELEVGNKMERVQGLISLISSLENIRKRLEQLQLGSDEKSIPPRRTLHTSASFLSFVNKLEQNYPLAKEETVQQLLIEIFEIWRPYIQQVELELLISKFTEALSGWRQHCKANKRDFNEVIRSLNEELIETRIALFLRQSDPKAVEERYSHWLKTCTEEAERFRVESTTAPAKQTRITPYPYIVDVESYKAGERAN